MELEALVSKQVASIAKLQQSLSFIEEELETVAEGQEHFEQYGRRQNLEITGLPFEKNENTNQKVIEVAKLLNVKLSQEDISTPHRLAAGEKSPVIVQFCRRDKRNEIFRKKANLIKENGGKKIFINESFTEWQRFLFNEARLLKDKFKYKYIWTHSGNVYVRKNESANSLKILSEDDLDRIR
ncbi:uncharacterized protein LOC144424485 [Styela clava]